MAVAVCLVAVPAGRAVGGEGPPPAGSYVVRAGDTVWGIAATLAGPGRDPRPLVDEILRRNHLVDAAIVPGQVLELPAA